MSELTEIQKQTLNAFFSASELKQKFYLTGGTALAAFYLHHRISDDLDFFTHEVEITDVERIIVDAFQFAGLRVEHERSSSTFRRYRVNGELQVDVVRDIDFRVGAPELIEGVMVDNPKNIAVNKICALYGRLDPKDYVDIYFIMQNYGYNIMDLLKLAKNKDAGLEFFQWTKVIADAQTLTILPKMIKEIKLNELKEFFRRLRDQVLDEIKPK